jgi:hypothetical protein
VVSLSITATVAVVAGVAAWWLGHTLGLEARCWLSGGVFVIVCLGGIAATELAGRARRADGSSSRFVMDDTTGITIGGLSIEDYLAREGRERKQDGDADKRR